MTIQNVIDLAKDTVLASLPVKDKAETIKQCIYLALIELYKRFNISIQSEIVKTINNIKIYDLRNTDISQVIAIYDTTGRELIESTIIGDKDYDYKQLNYRSFILNNPKDEDLIFVYKAAPKYITDPNEQLPLPTDFMPVLLDYVAYRCHSTINKDNVNEANIYYNRFLQGCEELKKEGYKVNLVPASLDVRDKGFI